MSSQLPAPVSFDLESVKVWYSCQKRGVDCSAWFYSIPALQKHFTERHPGDELNLPEHLPKEVLQGQIIFWEDGQPRRQWPHKADRIRATKTEVGSLQPNEVERKINCVVCNKSFSCLSILNFHMKRKHSDKGHPTSRKANNSEGRTVTKSCRAVSAAQNERGSLHKNSKTRKVMKMNHSFISHQLRCLYCSKSFGTEYNLRRHLVSHSGVCAYKCELCGTSTGLMDSLVKHLQHIHNVPVEDAKKMACQAGLKFLTTTKNLKLEDIDQAKINSTVIASIAKEADIQQSSVSVKVANSAKPSDKKKKIKTTTCPHCPYETKKAIRLNNHLQLHKIGFKAAVCNLCGWFVRPSIQCMRSHFRARRHPEVASTSNNN